MLNGKIQNLSNNVNFKKVSNFSVKNDVTPMELGSVLKGIQRLSPNASFQVNGVKTPAPSAAAIQDGFFRAIDKDTQFKTKVLNIKVDSNCNDKSEQNISLADVNKAISKNDKYIWKYC